MATIDRDNETDPDFLDKMHELLGMDKDKVEELIDKLDAEQMQDLIDAVAKGNKKSAKQIVDQTFPDEEDNVNSLFRGSNLGSGKKKDYKRSDGSEQQYAIGDDVEVTFRDHEGKRKRVTGTVASPEGPEGTDSIVVSIEGKKKVVSKNRVAKLDEGVLGMVNLPELVRMQQLAGIPAQTVEPSQPTAAISVKTITGNAEPEVEQQQDADPLCQVMSALETIETMLPNVRLADLKDVRARVVSLQTMMNESAQHNAGPLGRSRKS